MNKGTGAGGCRTNINGKQFEADTDFSNVLIDEYKFIRNSYSLINKIDSTTYIYTKQYNFRKIIKELFNLKLEYLKDLRIPDDAFIIINGNNVNIIIIEKKAQSCEGSVDNKLLASPVIKEEYRYLLSKINDFVFTIDYHLCLERCGF
jgi:hypothetical protein